VWPKQVKCPPGGLPVDISAAAAYDFPRVAPVRTRILKINPPSVDSRLIGEVAGILLGNGVMAYPTETFYGLGAAALSARAVARIYQLKARDPGKPLPVIASDLDMVGEIAGPLPPVFWTLAEEFWPGPLTLVLKASAAIPAFLAGPGGSIAVRIPPVSWVRRLVYEMSQPLTATSANLSGEEEITDAADVASVFEGKIELIVDGGAAPGGAPSTVLDLTTPEPGFLRVGAIPAEKIRAVLRA